jgi:hypothetical protein
MALDKTDVDASLAGRRALQLPELLQLILEHLEADGAGKALVAAARVNSVWADAATDIIWRRPGLSCLAAVSAVAGANSRGRRYYAAKICELQLIKRSHGAEFAIEAPLRALADVCSGGGGGGSGFDGGFPRLRQLTLDVNLARYPETVAAVREHALPALLRGRQRRRGRQSTQQQQQQRLLRLRLVGDTDEFGAVLDLFWPAVADAALEALEFHCRAWGHVDAEKTRAFFEACAQETLEGVSMSTALPRAVAVPALARFCSSCPALKRLAFASHLTTAHVEAIFLGAERPNLPVAVAAAAAAAAASASQLAVPRQTLSNLDDLRLSMASRDLPLLRSAIPHSLSQLHLTFGDKHPRTDVVLPAVASLQHLRTLELVFAFDADVDADDLLLLRRVARLRSLVLSPGQGATLSAPDVDCAALALLLADLGPGLRELQLWLLAPQLETIDSLRIVSARCPLLEDLGLCAHYDLRMLREEEPMHEQARAFPSLRLLRYLGPAGRGDAGSQIDADGDHTDDDGDDQWVTPAQLLSKHSFVFARSFESTLRCTWSIVSGSSL